MERIDYILIDKSLQQFVTKVKIMPAFSTDHSHPLMVCKGTLDPPGKGYWKLNNKLLDDEKFISTAVKTITEVLTDPEMDIFEKWELMKFSVKQKAIIRGSEIKMSEKNKLDALRKKLDEAVTQRDLINLNQNDPNVIRLFNDHNDRIDSLNQEIEQIHLSRTESAMYRTKAQWYQYAEKPTKYFFCTRST